MPRKKKVTDEAVLKNILAVIVERGTTVFSLNDLSRKTGLSPATLLQRFGSKQQILHKALELANQDLQFKLANRKIINNSPVQEIMAIYLELASPFKLPNEVANGLDMLKLDILEKKLNVLTREYFGIRRNKIQSLIDLAKEKQQLPQAVVSLEMAWNLEALWQGSIMLWALTGEDNLSTWLEARLKSFFKIYGVE